MLTLTDNWGLIGHRWAVDLLRSRLASDRAGHAYLITGAPGTGRSTLALRFAQMMNCTGENPPCGHCRACDLIERGVHPDVQIIAPEGRNIKIESIRDLQHDLSLRPVEARYRVAIIEEMQAATDNAADALLKTLEEPPATTRLLLTAESAETVRPTIVSRCQVVPLRPVRAELIAAALSERYEVPADEADTLARLSGGRPGWAITAAQNPAILEQRHEMIDQLLMLLQSDRTERFNFSESIYRTDALPLILDTWQSWWRDVMLVAAGSSVPPVNADRWDDLRDLAYDVTTEEAQAALQAVRRTTEMLGRYVNTRLALDVMLLDMPTIRR